MTGPGFAAGSPPMSGFPAAPPEWSGFALAGASRCGTLVAIG